MSELYFLGMNDRGKAVMQARIYNQFVPDFSKILLFCLLTCEGCCIEDRYLRVSHGLLLEFNGANLAVRRDTQDRQIPIPGYKSHSFIHSFILPSFYPTLHSFIYQPLI